MAYYLVQVAYSPEGAAALVKNPQNRMEAVRPIVEKLGGRIENFWFAFGEYDVVATCQMPDNVSATAFSLAVSASGAMKAFKTTPLMTVEEGMRAMQKAGEIGYKPPRS